MSHLSPSDLLDTLDAPLPEAAARHLAGCVRCRHERASLEGMLREVRQLDKPPPSPLFWEHFPRRVSAANRGRSCASTLEDGGMAPLVGSGRSCRDGGLDRACGAPWDAPVVGHAYIRRPAKSLGGGPRRRRSTTLRGRSWRRWRTTWTLTVSDAGGS
jgi:hypothetical protein